MNAPIFHRHGGTIETVTAIEHATHEGVADWEFRGRVRWQDGSVSESAHIPPWALCHDDSEASKACVLELMERMTRYLDAHGQWLRKPKHMRDGRLVHWQPTSPSGREELAPATTTQGEHHV